jgi:agarase
VTGSKKTAIILICLFLISCFTITSAEKLEEETNGFFRVEQINGRWCFLDPNGEPFFSTGICGISIGAGYAPDLGYSPYYQKTIELYGDEETWANVTKERMDTWGFNTAGYGDQCILATDIHYTMKLGLAGVNWLTGEVPDYFSEEWVEHAENVCKKKIINVSDDRNLIGYFLDNELHWGPDWRSLLDLFDTYCQFPADSAGKITLVNFLRQQYNDNISSFNLAWRTKFNDFNEILNVKILGMWPYTVKARNDHNAFTYIVAEQYFKTCYEKIKKYDENHLIIGARFQSYLTPIEVVEACKSYVDVISVNHYPARLFAFPLALIMQDIVGFTRPTNLLEEFHSISQKPILISEFYFRAKDSGLPNTKPSRLTMPVVLNQRQRALCFEIMTRLFIDKPYSVGYHWFAYVDQPETGRFDGENSNIGIVNKNDEPYEILVKRMTVVNKLAQETVKNQCLL